VRLGVRLRQSLPVLFTWSLVAQSLGLDGAGFAGISETPLGSKVTLHLRPPASASNIAAAHERIAAAYGAARVRVQADPLASDVVWLFFDYAVALSGVFYPWDGAGGGRGPPPPPPPPPRCDLCPLALTTVETRYSSSLWARAFSLAVSQVRESPTPFACSSLDYLSHVTCRSGG
jgi:hypothetical protein